jgi:ankyrin repeat protein
MGTEEKIILDSILLRHPKDLIRLTVFEPTGLAIISRCHSWLYGVDPNMRDRYLRTPLATAAYFGKENIVKILLERSDVLPNATEKRGRTPFHLAAEKGHIAIMKLLLGTNQVNVNCADVNGDTPLHFAAANGNREIAQFLFSNGAHADARNHEGRPPLFKAIETASVEMVKWLISTGQADPESRDSSGRTPFIHAVRVGKFPQALDGFGNKLKWAEAKREITILLHSAGLVHSTGHKAPTNAALEVLKYLLSLNQVDPNVRDQQGRTALF